MLPSLLQRGLPFPSTMNRPCTEPLELSLVIILSLLSLHKKNSKDCLIQCAISKLINPLFRLCPCIERCALRKVQLLVASSFILYLGSVFHNNLQILCAVTSKIYMKRTHSVCLHLPFNLHIYM